ncbi:MAG TPA: hypothetical protein VMU54_18615 [Planctomycetota bacterium]|nr:hypothetical protein [Planctomycetota bacterium]
MMPELTGEGLLPPGRHQATLGEIRRRFGGGNPARVRLMKGLEAVLRLPRKMEASVLYLDGSFVTNKKEPGDWDAVLLVPAGARIGSKEAILLANRPEIRKRYGGDLFTVSAEDPEVLAHYVDGVFVRDREGRAKGLAVIKLTRKEGEDGAHQE